MIYWFFYENLLLVLTTYCYLSYDFFSSEIAKVLTVLGFSILLAILKFSNSIYCCLRVLLLALEHTEVNDFEEDALFNLLLDRLALSDSWLSRPLMRAKWLYRFLRSSCAISANLLTIRLFYLSSRLLPKSLAACLYFNLSAAILVTCCSRFRLEASMAGLMVDKLWRCCL